MVCIVILAPLQLGIDNVVVTVINRKVGMGLYIHEVIVAARTAARMYKHGSVDGTVTCPILIIHERIPINTRIRRGKILISAMYLIVLISNGLELAGTQCHLSLGEEGTAGIERSIGGNATAVISVACIQKIH